jgi:hypothetical protein
MRKTREMPAEIVLSGHGEPITEYVGLIAGQPRNAYEVAQASRHD